MVLKGCHHGAGERTGLVRCLLRKHEGLCSIPQHPHKEPGAREHLLTWGHPRWIPWRSLSGWPSWVDGFQVLWKVLSQVQDGELWRKMPDVYLVSTCSCAPKHIHRNVYKTHTDYHKYLILVLNLPTSLYNILSWELYVLPWIYFPSSFLLTGCLSIATIFEILNLFI